jgi:DNA polymerase V
MNERTVNIADFAAAYNAKLARSTAVNVNQVYSLANGQPLSLPYFSSTVHAGFENPANDHIEEEIDPNGYLIDDPNATILIRVKGDSMIEAEIFEDDILIVNRKRRAHVGDIVVAELDGGFTVKYLGKHRLIPANPKYPTIKFQDMQELRLIGVVTGKMKRF